ncbi:MAG: hypothetical protein E3J86_01740 [Candidatus Thorarchaeota archaeon]|nr:MAG: hypothetical protein E3J86_01740 [Candidatus Thorarchaeota archaeon]
MIEQLSKFREYIKKFETLYSSLHLLVLAAEVEPNRYVVIRGLVILGSEKQIPGHYLPEYPIPKGFHLEYEVRDINTLERVVDEISTKQSITVNNRLLHFVCEKKQRWTVLRPRDQTRLFGDTAPYTARFSCDSFYEFDNSLYHMLERTVEEFPFHDYENVADFVTKTLGIDFDITHSTGLDFVAPTWTHFISISANEDGLEVLFSCPIIFENEITAAISLNNSKDDIGVVQYKSERLEIPESTGDGTPQDVKSFTKKAGFAIKIDDWQSYSRDISLKISILLSHEAAEVRLAKKEVLLTELDESNPNKVGYFHFRRAVDLAEKCPTESGKSTPKVGAVIVKDGEIISQAYRGEIGIGNHAEYIALERNARDDPRVRGADLITTLEPCTTRKHDKRPCANWIRSRELRKVWIGTLDYNPSIAGQGELVLQKAGIKIGRFPDDLSKRIIEQNEVFFRAIEIRQPNITKEDQRKERDAIILELQEKKGALLRELGLPKYETPKQTRVNVGDLISLKHKSTIELRIDKLEKALDHAYAVEINDVGGWIRLGGLIFQTEAYGLSHLAYSVASKIDAGERSSWRGLAEAEYALNKDWKLWPLLSSKELSDTSPKGVKSASWFHIGLVEKDAVERTRLFFRALQLGFRDSTSFLNQIRLIFQELTSPGPNEELWLHMYVMLERDGYFDASILCYSISELLKLKKKFPKISQNLQSLVLESKIPGVLLHSLINLVNLLSLDDINSDHIQKVLERLDIGIPDRTIRCVRMISKLRNHPEIRKKIKKIEMSRVP